MNKTHIRAWCLYDFANSGFVAVFVVLFNVYYVGHVVGNEEGLGDRWWGRAISASMAAVALSAPFMGAIADRTGRRKRLLAAYTGLVILATIGFTTLDQGMVVWGFVLAAIANFAYEGAVVFYNAYLPDIAPAEHHGRISGWGFGVGYTGSMLAIGAGILSIKVLNIGIEWVWLEVAVQFLVFSLPLFLWLPADRPGGPGILRAGMEGFRNTWTILREAMALVPLRRFLGAYFLYIDGVNTVIVFSAVFAARTLRFTQTQTLTLFLVVQMSACVGAFVLARPSDTRGPKFVVNASLVLWICVVVCAGVVQTKAQFFVLAAVAGFGLGSVQAASRSLMASLIPAGREGEFFGFYALCGKSSSILGPLVFGEASRAFGQRVSIVTVAVFFVAGFLLLRRVDAGHARAADVVPA